MVVPIIHRSSFESLYARDQWETRLLQELGFACDQVPCTVNDVIQNLTQSSIHELETTSKLAEIVDELSPFVKTLVLESVDSWIQRTNLKGSFYALQLILEDFADPHIVPPSINDNLQKLFSVSRKVGNAVRGLRTHAVVTIDHLESHYTDLLKYLRLALAEGSRLLDLLSSRSSLLTVFNYGISTLETDALVAQKRLAEALDLVSSFREENELARKRRDAECRLLCRLNRSWKAIFRKSSGFGPILWVVEILGLEISDELDDWREIYISTPLNVDQKQHFRQTLIFITKCLKAFENVQFSMGQIESLLPEFHRSSTSKAVVLTRIGNMVEKLLEVFEVRLRVVSDYVHKWGAGETVEDVGS